MKTIRICGLPITVFGNEGLDDILLKLLNGTKPASFHGYSIDTLHLMRMIPNLYTMREANDYFLCDGRGFYYFMKLLGVQGVSKLSLPALTMKLIELAARFNKSIFVLGASEDSNREATGRLVNEYGVCHVQGRNGYFTIANETLIVEQINELSPDILFLGMSSPKKDEFVFRWKDTLNVKIIVHCGGMIDIISGKTKMYPKWVKDMCLVWAYRFAQEPVRLRRDLFNALMGVLIAGKMLVNRRSSFAQLIK